MPGFYWTVARYTTSQRLDGAMYFVVGESPRISIVFWKSHQMTVKRPPGSSQILNRFPTHDFGVENSIVELNRSAVGSASVFLMWAV